ADGWETPNSAGRGSAYDYRPSPRQLRRSSPKLMTGTTLTRPRRIHAADVRFLSACKMTGGVHPDTALSLLLVNLRQKW
ncbi:hypothetical protein ACWERV_24195, partial [Streptomyces sp. NPDC004031]